MANINTLVTQRSVNLKALCWSFADLSKVRGLGEAVKPTPFMGGIHGLPPITRVYVHL